jgi:predicted metal-dependent hydrolase
MLPAYTHIVNSRLKHTYLSFDEEGNLIIKSPKVSQKYIETLLIKKSSWINSSKEKLLQKKGRALNFSKEEVLYLYGRTYPLVLQEYTKKRTKLLFDETQFTLYYSCYDESVFQKHIDRFYKEKALQDIPALVNNWSATMELSHNKISFRKTKRQWGSCSGKNDLSFNTMMMKLPEEVIHYIIVHELAHIRHKHHQKHFWSEVERHLPDYKQRIRALKHYTTQ